MSKRTKANDPIKRPATAFSPRTSASSSSQVAPRSHTPGPQSQSGSRRHISASKSRPGGKKARATASLAAVGEVEERENGGVSVGPLSRSRHKDEYGSLARPSVYDDGKPIQKNSTVIPDVFSESHQEFVNDPAHGYWKWDISSEWWYHRDNATGDIIWAPRNFA